MWVPDRSGAMAVDVEERLEELGRPLADGDFAALRTYLADEYYGATPEPGEPAACERIADLAHALRAAMHEPARPLEHSFKEVVARPSS